MNSEELSNYIFAKLAEAPKLSQDNMGTDETPFEHRKTYFRIKKYVDEFLDGYIENRFIIMPGLRGIGKTTILFQIYEYLRKENLTTSLDDLTYHYIVSELDLEEKLIQKDISNKILYLLEKEPERTRSIVLMRIEGYSYLEIAQKYEISESSARVIDYRAKKKIKETLIKEGVIYG